MKTSQYLLLAAFVALSAGCAAKTPVELVNARLAYQHASEGPAQQLVPAELHKAEDSLAVAEKSFQDDPDSYQTKDIAYVAERKAQQAEALGSLAAAKASKASADADFQKKQTELVAQGKQDLSDAEKLAAEKQAEIEKQAAVNAAATQAEADKQAAVQAANDKAAIDQQKQQAEILKGQQELQASEQRTAAALASLASLASLKEEQRGLVVTLSGGVLFRSNESTLMPAAQVKLDQVAQALLAIPARNLMVEGHTDSRGSDAYNQELSQRRADAVRDYLVQRGYPANRIQSRGQGEGSSIASNSSAEGRANNRRVEIVIEREPAL
jgi:outer membrane protein OmpA-like peptidoglycan-associated protein